MEPLEFLGGKYNGGEPISGVVQTYRATETETGRPVYVHRVSSGDDPAQQLVLYRLMAAALVRSPSVRKMILDMRDENDNWYVVTETAPQCLLLREWLQFELGSAAKASDGKQAAGTQSAPPPPLPPPELRREADPSPSPQPAAPLSPAAQGKEPGEFTRFFGTAPKTPGSDRPSSPDLPRSPERTMRSGSVQRPHTPMPFTPPVPPHGAEPGEFTRLFSKPGPGESGSSPRPSPERPKTSTDYHDPFKPQAEPVIPAKPPAQSPPGEFTRIFGKGDTPPPFQGSSALGKGTPANPDDPLFAPGSPGVNGPKGPAATGPSEYTRVVGSPPPAPSATPASGGSAEAPAGPSVTIPIPSASASITGPSVTKPMGSVQVKAPHPPTVSAPPLKMPTPNLQPPAVPGGAKNTKMIVFFAVLGLLALLLILIVVLSLRK